jgi:hypothetical protein
MDSHAALPLLIIIGVGVLLIYYRNNQYKKFRERLAYIEHRKEMLSKASVEERLESQRQQKIATEDKLRRGNDYLEQLEKAIQPTVTKLNRINVGLIPPTFRFDDSEELKDSIKECREKQYRCITSDEATISHRTWEWMGSLSDGEQMLNDYRALLLNAFNAEFEVIRRQMRAPTFDKAIEKVERLVDQLAKLGETTGVQISWDYTSLKKDELKCWHKELEHREQLKLERKRQREILRSQRSLVDDTEEVAEEIASRDSELLKARKKAEQLAGVERARLELLIEEIKAEKARLEEKQARAMSQAQLTRAGYIYVISNEGSFGEGIVKIGMTRRLEPMDRVNELGDASVPFKFDVHALAFVEDAPSFEKMLHDTFSDRRVNIENLRKEFFRVTPEVVREVMKQRGVDTDWYLTPEAKEYHESDLIRNAMRKAKRASNEPSESILPETI